MGTNELYFFVFISGKTCIFAVYNGCGAEEAWIVRQWKNVEEVGRRGKRCHVDGVKLLE